MTRRFSSVVSLRGWLRNEQNRLDDSGFDVFDERDLDNPTLRRLGVTLAAALASFAGTWLPVPEATLPGAAYFDLPTWPLSVGTLGLLPFMIGFVVAEFAGVSFAGDADLSRRDGRPTWIRTTGLSAGLICAIVAAIAIYLYWFGLIPGRLGGGTAAVAHGWGEHLVIVSTLVAGAVLYYGLADAVTHYGLGNGFAVIVGTGLLVDGYWAYRDFGGWLTSMSFENLDVFAVLGNISAVAGVILATLWMLYRMESWASGAEGGDGRYDVPLAGVIPFVVVKGMLVAGGTYGFVREMADPAALLRPAMRVWTVPGSGYFLVVSVALAIPVTLLLSFAFYRDGWSLSEWLSGDGDMRRFRRAAAATIGYVLLLVVVDLFGGQLVRSLGVGSVALGTAIACDLIGVHRYRATYRDAIRLQVVHRNRTAARLVDRLDRHGIEAHSSGRCFRGLLQIFGAFAPIEILVSENELQHAREVIRGDADASAGVVSDRDETAGVPS